MRVCVLGASGFLGHKLVDYFNEIGHDVVGINRQNYNSLKGHSFDLFINSNGNSKKFWANSHQVEDFEASVTSVQRSIFDFKFGQFIFISTSDVYPDHQSTRPTESEPIDEKKLVPYGFHKLLSERIVSKYCENYLILRCSALIGKHLAKGVLKDILEERSLFIRANSKIQFIQTNEVGKIVSKLISNNRTNQVYNVGGISNLSVKEVADILGKPITIQENAEFQYYDMCVDKLRREFPLNSSIEYVKELAREL